MLCLLQATNEAWVAKFFQWVGFNLALAFGASLSLFLISPAASGSGIPGERRASPQLRQTAQHCCWAGSCSHAFWHSISTVVWESPDIMLC